MLYRFLIEGGKGAILHTGDFRAEPCFLEAISRNPYVRRYLAQPPITLEHPDSSTRKTLDAIYLDTASLLSKLDVPTKVHSSSMAGGSPSSVTLDTDSIPAPETSNVGLDRTHDLVPANGTLFY
jgi:hypothetical protein